MEDIKNIGSVSPVAFSRVLDDNGIVLDKKEELIMYDVYKVIVPDTKEERLDYLQFEKDLVLTSTKYAECIGFKDKDEEKAADILRKIVELALEEHTTIEDYARSLDRGNKTYINKGDLLHGFKKFEPKVKLSEKMFEEIHLIINPQKDLKIYYYRFSENVSFLVVPILKTVAGRVLNGFDENGRELGVKVLADNLLTNGYFKIADLYDTLRFYDSFLTLNKTALLVSYLELPTKNGDLIKYQDFSSAFYQFMDKHNLRPASTLKLFFSQVASIKSSSSNVYESRADHQSVSPVKVKEYLMTLRQKLKILNSDDSSDLFERMDSDKSQYVTSEEFFSLISSKIPEIPNSMLPEMYNCFSKSDLKGVNKKAFISVMNEIPLLDKIELIFEKTKWGEVIYKMILENLKKTQLNLPYLAGGQEVDLMAFYDVLVTKVGLMGNDNLLRLLKVYRESDSNTKIVVQDFMSVLARYDTGSRGLVKTHSSVMIEMEMTERTKEIMEGLRSKFKGKPYTLYAKLFQKIDKSSGGSIDFSEFWDFIRYFEKGVQKKEAMTIFNLIDSNGSDNITIDEFTEFFGLSKLTDQDNSVIMNLKNVLDDGQYGPILSEIHRKLIEMKQTPESVFNFSQTPTIKKGEFQSLLHAIQVTEEKFELFGSFVSVLEFKKNPNLIDLDKFKGMLDGYFQTHMSELTSKMDSNFEMIFYSLLAAYDNSISTVLEVYDRDKSGSITKSEFIIVTRKTIPSVSKEDVNALFDVLKDPASSKVSTLSLKAKLLAVHSKYNSRSNPDHTIPSTPRMTQSIIIDPLFSSQVDIPTKSKVDDITPVSGRLSPEEEKTKRLDALYAKIRKDLDYKEDVLLARLKQEDPNHLRKIHQNYIIKVLDMLNIKLAESEKTLLLENLEKSEDQVYYFDLLGKIFPLKQLAGEQIHNLQDLVQILMEEMQLQAKPLKSLFNELKLDAKLDHLTLANLKKALMMRGLLLPMKKLESIYEEMDRSKNFKVEFEEFKEVFTKGSNVDTGKVLEQKVRGQLKVLNKDAHQVFFEHQDKDNKLNFAAFMKALQGTQLDLNIFQLETLFEHVDKDHSGSLDFTELAKSFNQPPVTLLLDLNNDEIRKAIYKNIKKSKLSFAEFFKYYDAMKMERLRLVDFTNMLTSIGFDSLKKEDIEKMFKTLDTDLDYQLSFSEFSKFYDESTITVLFPFIFKFKTYIREKVQNDKVGIFYIVRQFSESNLNYLTYPEFCNLLKELKLGDMPETDKTLLFNDLDIKKDDRLSEAELRYAANGSRIVDVVDLVRKVRDVIQDKRIQVVPAFDRANSNNDEGLSFIKFNDFIGSFLRINLNLIETEELFLFSNLKNNGKLSKDEFVKIFDDYSTKALNPFVINKPYMDNLTDEGRAFYIKRYRIDPNAIDKVEVDRPIESISIQGGISKTNEMATNSTAVSEPRRAISGVQVANHYFTNGDLKFTTRVIKTLNEKGGITLDEFLSHFDEDKDGSVSLSELSRMDTFIDSKLTEEQKKLVLSNMNPNPKTNKTTRNDFKLYIEQVKPMLSDPMLEARMMIPVIEKASKQRVLETGKDLTTIFKEYSFNSRLVHGLPEFIRFVKDLPLDVIYSEKDIAEFFNFLDDKKENAVSIAQYKAIFKDYEEFERESNSRIEKGLIDFIRVHMEQYGGKNALEFFLSLDHKSTFTIREDEFINFFKEHKMLEDDDKLHRLASIFGANKRVDYLSFLDRMGILDQTVVKGLKASQNDVTAQTKLIENFKAFVEIYCKSKAIQVSLFFDEFDVEKKGFINQVAFETMVKAVDRDKIYGYLEKEALYQLIDGNKSGMITKNEFYQVILKEQYQDFKNQSLKKFNAEFQTINNSLATRKIKTIREFLRTKDECIPFKIYEDNIPLLGLNQKDPRFHELMVALEDEENKGMIKVAELQDRLDYVRENKSVIDSQIDPSNKQ